MQKICYCDRLKSKLGIVRIRKKISNYFNESKFKKLWFIYKIEVVCKFKLVEEEEYYMMPLILSNTGEEVVIKKISGSDKTRTFLNSIGFVVGTNVKIVSKIDGNLIIDVKDTRVALDKKMASRIII